MAELAGDLMTQMGQTDAEKAFRPWWEKLNLIQEIQLEIRFLLLRWDLIEDGILYVFVVMGNSFQFALVTIITTIIDKLFYF